MMGKMNYRHGSNNNAHSFDNGKFYPDVVTESSSKVLMHGSNNNARMGKMNYRHGDLALIEIDKLPDVVTESSSKVLMHGSNNNAHSFDNGKFYPVTPVGCVFGYFVAKDTTLFHKEHGKIIAGKELREAKIADGVYEIRNQIEYTNDGMRKVVD